MFLRILVAVVSGAVFFIPCCCVAVGSENVYNSRAD